MEYQKTSQRPADGINSRQDSDHHRQLFKQLFVQPIFAQKSRLWFIALALVLLSLAQSAFLLLAGPLLKAFFEFSAHTTHIPLAELVPPQILEQLPQLQSLQVSASHLTLWLPTLLLCAGLIKGLAGYLYHYQQNALSLNVAKHYRDQLFAALLQQPYEQLAKTSAGRWMSMIMNDVMVLQAKFSDLLGGVVKDGIMVISCIIVLFWVHWPTALILMGLSPILAFWLGRSGRRISHFAEAWQARLADMTSHLLSLRQRFDFIRSQRGEARESESFQLHNQSYFRMICRSLWVRSMLAPSLEFLGFVVFALLILMIHQGIWFQDDFSGVVLVQFFAALGLIMRPLRAIGEQIARFQETKGSLRSSLQTFKTLRAQAKRSPVAHAEKWPGQAEIHKIALSYDDKPAFAAEKLKLAAGAGIAIIGPSGSGKSTLLKSLAGLIPPKDFSANLSWQEIVAQTAYVSQKTFLFDDSILENLSYGSEHHPQPDELRQALQAVNLWDEISHLPDGLDTGIQSVQNNFSGGQMQRLMLARALLRDRPLLLLDESTSAIDAKTEESIINSLLQRCRASGQILLFVTHRLRWLELFDQVWFVENGRLRLRGTHGELLKDDRYQNFLAET
ncbi:MAG: ABC transporter transmembrane domain-containing protein [Oligoflexus sp.]